jgi:hypothetical protein
VISTLKLARRDQARLWLGELPSELAFAAKTQVERAIAGGSALPAWTSVALEVLLPRGPMAVYGALGIRFESSPGGAIQLRVGSSDEGKPAASTLAGRLDQVRAGLPSEFVPSVLEGLSAGAHLVGLGPGSLAVLHAATGAAGSNAWVFERLGRAAAVLLAAPEGTDWQSTLSELFE